MISSRRSLGGAGFDFRPDSGIDAQIILDHPRGAETFFENAAASFPAELRDPFEALDRLIDAVHDEAGDSVVYDFRHRAAAKCNCRRAARHRFNHNKAEGLGPVDRKKLRVGVAEKLLLFLLTDLADI